MKTQPKSSHKRAYLIRLKDRDDGAKGSSIMLLTAKFLESNNNFRNVSNKAFNLAFTVEIEGKAGQFQRKQGLR